MMEITWILTAASVLGAALNAMGRRSGFVVWIGSNTGWVIANASRALWPEAMLFLAYLGFSVVGFFMSGIAAKKQECEALADAP